MRIFQIDLDYACFGIITENSIVINAPPIAGWMIGKQLKDIKPWLVKRKAKVYECKSVREEPLASS